MNRRSCPGCADRYPIIVVSSKHMHHHNGEVLFECEADIGGVSKHERVLLHRIFDQSASFTYAPVSAGDRHARLIRSSYPEGQRDAFHALAVQGYLAERVQGCGGIGEPPTTVVTYLLTALGRQAIGLHAEPKPPVHWHKPPTDVELEADGIA